MATGVALEAARVNTGFPFCFDSFISSRYAFGNIENITEAAIEARARRAAKRCGWYLQKSRSRRLSIDDYGKLMIIDPDTNSVVAGKRFDFSAEECD